MRVVINGLAALKPKTGVGHYVANLARCLVVEFPEDEFWLYPGDRLARYIRRLNRSPAPGRVTARNSSSSIRSIAAAASVGLKQLAKSMSRYHFLASARRSRFDLYHEPNFIPYRSPIPTVVTVHDLSVLRFPDWHPADRVRLHSHRFAEGLRWATHVITVSEAVRSEVITDLGLPPDRVTAVPNGIGPAFRPHEQSEILPVRDKLGLPPRYLLCVGTIEPRKNVGTLMRAYVDLPEAIRAECPLVLVGPWGWKSESDRTFYDEVGGHNGIWHLGYVSEDDLPAVYAGAVALIYPSNYEGFGLPPVEMLACDGAVVASAIPAVREVCGDHCAYVDPADVAGWRAVMQRLITEHEYANEIRKGGVEHSAQYTWGRTARETAAIYRRVLANPASSSRPAT